jgi:hypothetical protein
MSSAKEYRVIAEDCIRMASTAQDERDRPLWVTMAQSWLRLAEHADRITRQLKSGVPADGDDQHTTGSSEAPR